MPKTKTNHSNWILQWRASNSFCVPKWKLGQSFKRKTVVIWLAATTSFCLSNIHTLFLRTFFVSLVWTWNLFGLLRRPEILVFGTHLSWSTPAIYTLRSAATQAVASIAIQTVVWFDWMMVIVGRILNDGIDTVVIINGNRDTLYGAIWRCFWCDWNGFCQAIQMTLFGKCNCGHNHVFAM